MSSETVRTRHIGDLRIDDHTLTVPLDWGNPDDGRTIDIFASVVTRPGGEDLPYLTFLQGGPGCEAPRVTHSPTTPDWLDVALEHYRVVMLDQRGTGNSTPVGDKDLSKGAAFLAEYLTHLRADSIVEDAEALREHLGAKQWNTLGQSFGGFTTLAYLTKHAESLDNVYVTGGLSAVGHHPDDVYGLCYEKMRAYSEAYYRRFPEHRDVVRSLVGMAERGEIVLPSGEVVSPSRIRSLGHILGADNGWITLHNLLERDPRTNAFLYDLEHALPFGGRDILYYVIHESSYSDGFVTDWSAERTFPDAFRRDPTLLTGEHVRREWADTVPAFQPWKEVIDKIAQVKWPKLYDAEVLKNSGATGAAAVYVNDCYVPHEFSLETSRLLPGVKTYVTSLHEHNGLRASGGAVLRHLIDLAHGRKVR